MNIIITESQFKRLISEELTDFDEFKFVDEILKNGIKNPEVAIAQSLWESGHFKSNVCLNYNNLFGMRFPKKRSTTATGAAPNGHAIYNNWRDSVKDYKLWQDNWGIGSLSEDEYINKLNDIYCPSKSKGGDCLSDDYSSAIRKMLPKATKILFSPPLKK